MQMLTAEMAIAFTGNARSLRGTFGPLVRQPNPVFGDETTLEVFERIHLDSLTQWINEPESGEPA